MILVVGATGNVGGAAVRALAAAGAEVRAFSRDPSSVATLGADVEPFAGDVTQPASVAAALRGATQVLLCAAAPDLASLEPRLVHQAEEAAVEHLVLLSSLGVEYGAASGPAHKPGEDAARASPIACTILRPSAYMTNALRWADSIRANGTFEEPTGDGRHAMIDPRDIGEVAAAVLMSPDHAGGIHELTGPQALSSAEYAGKLSAAAGRPVRHVDVDAAVFRDRFLQAGMPAAVVEPVVAFYALVKAGRFTAVSPAVEQILGRPGRTFDVWAAEHATAFA